ncbi:MAG: hypothetical protein NTW11_00260 [Candidatus Staskawiczbacteria bacterium]|nr:hypothetical protein [Candidatus Staskawiczbacteria bacterium]
MWQKTVVIIFLFIIFALLQNSFFAHFSIFGATPNLVFILFFLLVFFAKKETNYQIIYLSVIAGILLDIFSYAYLGPSIVSLLIGGFLLKKAQSMLKSGRDSYPFTYYLPLFLIFFAIYEICFLGFNLGIIAEIIYNMVFASAFFYVYKRWIKYTA